MPKLDKQEHNDSDVHYIEDNFHDEIGIDDDD